jgi:hypothetical protein
VPVQFPNFIAYLPCPIKVPFEQALTEYLAKENHSSITVQIEGNANKNEADYAALVGANRAEELPLLMITPGVNRLFYREFLEKVLDRGYYEDVAEYRFDPERRETILRDPLGHATVLAANVTVMVVDHTHLGSRPPPKGWKDLLDPAFTNSVLMRGNGTTYCETTLLAWQQLYGDDGLKQLGRSVREGYHPAQMAKVAGTGQKTGAAVYVMPYFFARNIRHQGAVSIIWPDDGVIASPMTLYAKRGLSSEFAALAKWLAGPVVARLFTVAGLPTPHPDVPSGLPSDIHYVWTGWERARSSDLSVALSTAESAFASGQR